MSKSKSFYGLRSGSTKSHTYAVLKGQQVTKDRVTDVANPKTTKQMIQRMLFANAVKFFKHGQAAFFKFAFEDKKRLESDYNAFMRHNSKAAVAVSRENYNDPVYPAFGRYMLTYGSMVSPVVGWSGDNKSAGFEIQVIATVQNTVGELSSAILNKYPSLMEGDIVTILLVHTSLKADGTLSDERVNRWEIRQFILNVNDTRDSTDALGITNNDEGDAVIANIAGSDLDDTHAKGCAVVFSRNTPNGLKVSTSNIIGNGIAEQFIEQYGEEAMLKAMANTWGANGSAVLQGSIAEQQMQG